MLGILRGFLNSDGMLARNLRGSLFCGYSLRIRFQQLDVPVCHLPLEALKLLLESPLKSPSWPNTVLLADEMGKGKSPRVS